MPGPGQLRYDPRELRRVIAMSFSAGELSKFAERWRVFTDREGTSDDGARTLVKALETRDKLDALVESLRAQKPLVEWPEPTLPPLPVAPISPTVTDGEAPAAEPASLRAGAAVAPTVMQGPASLRAPSSERVPTSQRVLGGAPPRHEGPIIDPYLEHQAEERAQRRSEMRWLPFAAVAFLGFGVGAVVIYLALRKPDAAQEPAVATVAEIASRHLRDRVDAVAAACDVEGTGAGDSSRETLMRAFAECATPEIRPGKLPPDPASPSRATAPNPQRPMAGRPQGGNTPVCLDQCHAEFESCVSSTCGEEPQSANDYADYQRCSGACQSKYVRCRLVCH